MIYYTVPSLKLEQAKRDILMGIIAYLHNHPRLDTDEAYKRAYRLALSLYIRKNFTKIPSNVLDNFLPTHIQFMIDDIGPAAEEYKHDAEYLIYINQKYGLDPTAFCD